MKPLSQLPTQVGTRQLFTHTLKRSAAINPALATSCRTIHNSAPDPANVSPFYATGPPPEPPQPAAEHPYAKIERRRKQAELLKKAKELRNATSTGKAAAAPLKKRFWENVHVKEIDGRSCPSNLVFPNWKKRKPAHSGGTMKFQPANRALYRQLPDPPRHAPPPPPSHQRSSPPSALQTPPRTRSRSRMGPHNFGPTSHSPTSNPADLPHLPRARCSSRRCRAQRR